MVALRVTVYRVWRNEFLHFYSAAIWHVVTLYKPSTTCGRQDILMDFHSATIATEGFRGGAVYLWLWAVRVAVCRGRCGEHFCWMGGRCKRQEFAHPVDDRRRPPRSSAWVPSEARQICERYPSWPSISLGQQERDNGPNDRRWRKMRVRKARQVNVLQKEETATVRKAWKKLLLSQRMWSCWES